MVLGCIIDWGLGRTKGVCGTGCIIAEGGIGINECGA